MYAIGSLLPLSNSNTGRNLCLSPNPLERRIEKTEAESVAVSYTHLTLPTTL